MTDDYASERHEEEDFEAVLDDLSIDQLRSLARMAILFMNKKDLLYFAFLAISEMNPREMLQLVLDHTPGQYAICVRNSGINEDLRVTGIPERGA